MTATANTEHVTYQWLRADTEAGTYTEINGATNKIYALADADKDKYIKVKVKGIAGKATGEETSDPTAKVQLVDAVIGAPSGTFYHNAEKDITATITWSSATKITKIKTGDVELVENKDYTVAGNTLTIKKEYFKKDPVISGATGFGVEFDRGSTFSLIVNIATKYQVVFYANDGSGSMDNDTAANDQDYTFPANGFTAPVGKVFNKWKVKSNDTYVYYAVGDTKQILFGNVESDGKTIKIYATWKIPQKCTVSFDANDGTGNMTDVEVTEGEKYELPANKFTAPEHKEFHYWKVGNSTNEYKPGDKVEITENTTIKAVWRNMQIEIWDVPDTALTGQSYYLPISIDGKYESNLDNVLISLEGANRTNTKYNENMRLVVAADETAEQLTLRASRKDNSSVYHEVTIKVEASNALTISKEDESIDKLSTDGYKWDKDNKTLTIQNLTINGNGQGIVFDGFTSKDTITLELEGTNIINTGGKNKVVGIGYSGSDPNLTIKGTGSLEITMPDLSAVNSSSYGINVWSLSVEGNASLKITGVKANDARGINTSNPTSFKDNAKVEVESYGTVVNAAGSAGSIYIENQAQFKGIARNKNPMLVTNYDIKIETGTKVELIRYNLPTAYGGPRFFDYDSNLILAEGLKLQGSVNTEDSGLEAAKLTDDKPKKVVRESDSQDVFKYVLIKAN